VAGAGAGIFVAATAVRIVAAIFAACHPVCLEFRHVGS